MQKVKVLHVVSSLKTGGVEKLLYDLYKHIDRNEIEFSFITHNNPGIIEEYLIKKNVKVFHLINRRKHPVLSAVQFYKFLLRNHFDIIHFHGNFEIVLEFIAAKFAKEENLIVHSHNYKKKLPIILKIINHIAQKLFVLYAKMCIGCSKAAGYYGFGNIKKIDNYVTLYNSIEIDKYKYNENTRSIVRKQLNIQTNEFVIGTIGRLTKQKNQIFLLNVIEKLRSYNQFIKVLIVGEGEDCNLLKKFVVKNKLNDIVIFLGVRKDIPDLLNSMDLFILTSKYEGLPIVGVEAQASGLPCLFSEEITQEIKIFDKVLFLSVNDIEIWVKTIKKVIKESSSDNRNRLFDSRICKYNIQDMAIQLAKIYHSILLKVK